MLYWHRTLSIRHQRFFIKSTCLKCCYKKTPVFICDIQVALCFLWVSQVILLLYPKSCVFYRICIAVVIPQRLQLQVQVTLSSLCWRHKSEECAKSCARRSVCFLRSERWRCQYWSAYVAAAVMWLKWAGRTVCEARAEGLRVKWRGLFVCNPVIFLILLTLCRSQVFHNRLPEDSWIHFCNDWFEI